jgi:hypothetical protein
MEMRNGFIVGLYNYCDRWCETCSLTSHCRLFAEYAAHEAARDPAFTALVNAPPLPQDVPPPPPKWLDELLERMHEEASRLDACHSEYVEREPRPEHAVIQARADDYCSAVYDWLQAMNAFNVENNSDPRAIVHWFSTMIPAKVARALWGLAQDEPEERDWPADHDGSAKVALLGIDRSHAAWLEMVSRGLASPGDAEPFVANLVRLRRELEHVFPDARGFVRPGLDEPDQLQKLAGEGNC